MSLSSFVKRTILRTVQRFGYVLIRDDFQPPSNAFDDTQASFRNFCERVQPFTMTTVERLYAMYSATEYIVKAGIPGDIVECGVWRGGSMMMAALSLQALGDTSRRLICFDTFAGHPRPDPKRDGALAYQEWEQQKITEKSSHWAEVSAEEVAQNIYSTGYPPENVKLVKGMVEDTLPGNLPSQIALLRLDTDWYESTMQEMKYLYPLIADKGVLILDDYGCLAGARQAVDQYFKDNGIVPLLNRIDASGRLVLKTRTSRV
jgi:O-methyltransferase